MSILMISSTFPYPPSRGGTEIRTCNLLKYLAQRHKVTLVTQRPPDASEAEIEALRQWVELVLFPFPQPFVPSTSLWRYWGQAQRWFTAFRTTTPPNVLYRYSAEMQRWINAAVLSGQFQVVTCEHSVNEIYVQPEFRYAVKTVVNVHSSVYGWTRNHLDMGASSHPGRDRLYLPLLKRYEQRYCTKFSQIVVTSDDDRDELKRLGAEAPMTIIPNGVDLALFPYRTHDPSGYDLVFAGGMDASHNIDAVRFFALEVMPTLRDRYPTATFSIVGSRPTAEVLALGERPGVTILGKVAAMVEPLHKATVCVVPLRTGFGIKNKTLEAMAAGVPVVGSDRGLEGIAIDGPDGSRRALRANRVEEYISAISQLFESAELRSHLSQSGRSLIEQEFTWEQAGRRYEQALFNR